MSYNNPERRFWHSLLFRRITAGLIFLACFQANYIFFGIVVAIIHGMIGVVLGVLVFYVSYKKLKYKKTNYILR